MTGSEPSSNDPSNLAETQCPSGSDTAQNTETSLENASHAENDVSNPMTFLEGDAYITLKLECFSRTPSPEAEIQLPFFGTQSPEKETLSQEIETETRQIQMTG